MADRRRPSRAPADAIDDVIRLLRSHPAIRSAEIASTSGAGTIVAIGIAVALPNAWMATGESPDGVRALEPVVLDFPPAYPLKAPTPRLRGDFDRTLAHVQPGPASEPPVPCIYAGDLTELLHRDGLQAIINRLVTWLEDAALHRLIDPEQGWEPVRRDSLSDTVFADGARLRSLVGRRAGRAILPLRYMIFETMSGGTALRGDLGAETIAFNATTIEKLFQTSARQPGRPPIETSIAIVAWPGRDGSGAPVVADRYLPETVADLAGLRARADEYGCRAPLEEAFSWIAACVREKETVAPLPIVVLLCARRPCAMLDADSDIELVPYRLSISAPVLFPEGDRTPVQPCGHREAITPTLLRALSGGDDAVRPWVQLGAGSLGSKIALHLTRAGRAPTHVIDHARMGPHHAARHGLLPQPAQFQEVWTGAKAKMLADAISGLGQKAEAVDANLLDLIGDPKRLAAAMPRTSWALVNSTASLAVRAALSGARASVPRVIDTSLFAAGRIGLLSVEGPARNPNCGDLIGEAYAVIREQPALAAAMFSPDPSFRHVMIGEGCGATTMLVSDAQIAAFAAPMTQAIGALQSAGLPAAHGGLLIGHVGTDGLSLAWQQHDVAPAILVQFEDRSDWEVRVGARAHAKIAAEVARHPRVETGGVLIGRMVAAARTFHVIDVLPAPADSQRTADAFVLGTEGLAEAIEAYTASCAHSLTVLGTWHSHLGATPPSERDRQTAIHIGGARLAPSMLLVHTPVGYRALLARHAMAAEGEGECR